MDPPSADEEWRSLVDETNNDHHAVDVTGHQPPPSSRGSVGRGGHGRVGGGRGGRRPNSTASNTSTSSNSSNTSSTLANFLDTNLSGFSFRHMLIIFILAGMVGMLVIITSNAEVSVETDMVTEVELAHHDAKQNNAMVENTMGAVIDESAEKNANNIGAANGEEPQTDSTNEEETTETPVSAETPTSNSNNNNNNNQNKKFLLGFHDPSPESLTHANIFLKPKGAGYPLAPQGGLHPIYFHDAANNDEERQLLKILTEDHETFAQTSPYADARLKMTEEERAAENKSWLDHLEQIRKDYGYWDFKDTYGEKNGGKGRPVVDFEAIGKVKQEKNGDYNVLHGEIDKEDFPEGSWQTDDEYVGTFLKEARTLIHRVREGIYAEYGWARDSLTDEQVAQRSINFGVHLLPADAPPSKNVDANSGIAWMYEDSFQKFVKKLLNAMITNDHFFVILGGHSAAAGHGNNFHQSYMMQFQEVMEPVFDRLGMVLVSANRAQGGMGTLQAALAGESILGERDVMLWDSSMTEKGGGHQDVFMRQALLSGHRVPVLLDLGGGKGTIDKLHNEVGASVGGLTLGNPSFIKETTDDEQAKTLPFAVAHLFCTKGNDSCNAKQNKYNAHCWTDRVDVDPITEQDTGYGSQVSWHPGFRTHKWNGRRLALLFLHALEEAITLWETTAASEGNPLDGKHWHIAQEENELRDKLRSVDLSTTECGKLLEGVKRVPRICATAMKGATQWAPRANPDHSSIISLMKPSPSGYLPELFEKPVNQYDGRDPHFPIQKIPDGEVDVAAIARSISPPSARRRSLTISQTKLLSVRNAIQQNRSSNPAQMQQLRGRELAEESAIVPGEGWTVIGHPAGFCDGTSNSECHRESEQKCLMGGHNDSRGVLKGDGLSGWAVFDLKNVKEGIFVARIEMWHAHNSNPRTEGWTSENNARRRLKAPPPPLPEDYALEVAVNGKVLHRFDKAGFEEHCGGEVAYNVGLCVFVDDKELASNSVDGNMEVAIRVSGGGRESVLAISHVYYA